MLSTCAFSPAICSCMPIPCADLMRPPRGDVYDFLEDWFPRKALWASVSSMKVYLASFKKFFKWMGETSLVSPGMVEDVLSTLKDDRNFCLRKGAEEFPEGGARSPTDPALQTVRELWRMAVGGVPRPTHIDDVPGVGPPHPGGEALSQYGV